MAVPAGAPDISGEDVGQKLKIRDDPVLEFGWGVQATNSLVEKLKIPIPGNPPYQPSVLMSFAMWVVEMDSRKVMPFRNLMASTHQSMSAKKEASRMIQRPEEVALRLVAVTASNIIVYICFRKDLSFE